MISKRGATTRNPTKEIGTSAKGSLIEASDATKDRSAPPNVVSRQKSATASRESIPRFTVSAHFSTASLIALRRSSSDSVVTASLSSVYIAIGSSQSAGARSALRAGLPAPLGVAGAERSAASVIVAPRSRAGRSPRLRDFYRTESPSHSAVRPRHGEGRG